MGIATSVAFAQQQKPSKPDQGGAKRGKPTWERVSKHDTDKDGKVTKAEFKGPEMAFTRFDSNKDGAITEEEMKNLAPRSGGKGEGKGERGGKGKGEGKGERGGKKGGQSQDATSAPEVGAAAPQLKAQKLGSEEIVDLGKVNKTTVLIFGSYS